MSNRMKDVQHQARALSLIDDLQQAYELGDEYDKEFIAFMWKASRAFRKLPIAEGKGVPDYSKAK